MKRILTTEQWIVLERLKAGGCPISGTDLVCEPCPLEVTAVSGLNGTNFFPCDGHTGFCLYLRAVAVCPITIRSFTVRAAWLDRPIRWVEECSEHPRHHCVQLAPDSKHLSLPSKEVLNPWMERALPVKRGQALRGYLLGWLPVEMRMEAEEKLRAALCFLDNSGKEYGVPISLVTRPSNPVV